MPSIPPPSASLLEPGFRLDRWELLCRIGQGGMASVWLARDVGGADGDMVAIKTILPEHAQNDAFRAMMLDEARIVRLIHHPNVAATLELGEVFGAPYLVLEYVPGESLDQLSEALADKKRPLQPSILVKVLGDACRGLHAAHELAAPDGENLGLVHRDLSPQNVLVDDRGRVKLIDFGVAKAAERLAPNTQSGVMKGKIPFMAPEQARGEDVDRRADVWAAGAIAYFLLAGKYPHDAPNDAARLIKKLSGEAPEPLPDAVPKELAAVVMRALATDPDERPATARELAEALAEAEAPATTEEVARYFGEALAPTKRARELVVEHAILAAEQRHRNREALLGGATAPTSVRPPPPDDDHAGAAPLEKPKRGALLVYAAIAALLTFGAFVLGSLTTKRREPIAAPPATVVVTVPVPVAASASAPERAAASATVATTPSAGSASASASTTATSTAPSPATSIGATAAPSASAGARAPRKDAEVEDTIF